MKAQEEQGEDANSLHEESHVSDRHMMWWRNAWWIRIDSGPHLRTARDRRRAWRAATRAAREARETRKASEGEREKWETGSKESNASNTLHIVLHLPQQQQQQARLPQQQQQQHPQQCDCSVIAVRISAGGRDVPVMLFNEACHRSVDLERPMYYNETNDGQYVPRAILLDFEPGTTASVRDRKDDSSGVRQLPHRLCAGCGEDGGGRLRLPERWKPIDSLGANTNVSMTTDTLRTFQPFEDFANINYKDLLSAYHRCPHAIHARFSILDILRTTMMRGYRRPRKRLNTPTTGSRRPCTSTLWMMIPSLATPRPRDRGQTRSGCKDRFHH